jgi:hypothetical protein
MSTLYEEKKEKQTTVDHLELELSSLEQRSILIIKEKKYLETLIFKYDIDYSDYRSVSLLENCVK